MEICGYCYSYAHSYRKQCQLGRRYYITDSDELFSSIFWIILKHTRLFLHLVKTIYYVVYY